MFLSVDHVFVSPVTPTVVRHEWVFQNVEWKIEIQRRKHNVIFPHLYFDHEILLNSAFDYLSFEKFKMNLLNYFALNIMIPLLDSIWQRPWSVGRPEVAPVLCLIPATTRNCSDFKRQL